MAEWSDCVKVGTSFGFLPFLQEDIQFCLKYIYKTTYTSTQPDTTICPLFSVSCTVCTVYNTIFKFLFVNIGLTRVHLELNL